MIKARPQWGDEQVRQGHKSRAVEKHTEAGISRLEDVLKVMLLRAKRLQNHLNIHLGVGWMKEDEVSNSHVLLGEVVVLKS